MTKKRPRVCVVLNIAPLYRNKLLKKLDENLYIDFFFYSGDMDMQISTLTDMSQLSGFQGYLKNRFSGTKLIWQKGWTKILTQKYDAIIMTGNPGIRSNWLLLILAKMAKKKVYLWSHGVYGNESSLQKIKNISYMRMATALLLYGEYGKLQLIKNRFPRRKMTVIYNSLDTEKQQTLRGREEDGAFLRNYFGNDAPTIIFLGRLTPQKSLNLLIEALGILKSQGTECNAIIVGSGPEEENLQKRTKEVGVEERIWFYGDCYDEDMIATLFKLSTICVSPGNVGLTAMHSLSYGVPVITHNKFCKQMPEFEAIKRWKTGDFFSYNDAISLSDVTYNWIKLMRDPENKKNCAEECINIIDKVYNPDNQSNIITNRILSDLKLLSSVK